MATQIATCWSTSSACAARWTSCSATSGARAAGCRPAADRLLAAGRRLLLRRAAAGDRQGRARRGRASTRSASRSSGASCVIRGERPVQETEGRVYQQVEIEAGPFRRVVELNADVVAEEARATYEDGVLRVELPLRRAAGQPARPDRDRGVALDGARRTPDGVTEDDGPTIEVVEDAGRRGGDPRARGPAASRRAAGAAAEGDGHLPGHADPAGGRAGALDQARQRRPLGRADAGAGRRRATPRSRSPGPTSSTTSASRGSSPGC